jgi:hypothetical protein
MAHDDFKLYAEDLDEMVAVARPPDAQGVATIALPSTCHGTQTVIALFTEGSGQVFLVCSVCEKPMCSLQLASRPAKPAPEPGERPAGGSVVEFRPRRKK